MRRVCASTIAHKLCEWLSVSAAMPRQFHQQTIGKLVAGFAGVDVRRDHLGRACFVKRLNKFQCIGLALESSERTRGLAAAFQPFPTSARFFCAKSERTKTSWMCFSVATVFGNGITVSPFNMGSDLSFARAARYSSAVTGRPCKLISSDINAPSCSHRR